MAHNIVMPALEMAQENGKLLSWRKKEGESVTKGEPLLEIETDKAVVEIESPGDGILAGVKAHEGDVIPVGQTIAWIVLPGEKPPAETQPSATGRRMETKVSSAPPAAAAKTSSGPAIASAVRSGASRESTASTSAACAAQAAKEKFSPKMSRRWWRHPARQRKHPLPALLK